MKVDFIYDVATPNGYLAHKVIPEFEKRTNTTFNYIPCLNYEEDWVEVLKNMSKK